MGPKHDHDAHFTWSSSTTSSLAWICCEAFGSGREASWTMARRRIVEGVFGGGNVVLPACSAWWERASEGLGTFVRNAMKKAGGSTRNGRDSNPKYLGIKKSAGSWIAPGNIIVRQRGTKFHPGEHVLMGKDHTLMALESGKVRFDRDKVTKRVFISVDVHAQRKTKKNLIPIAN